MSCQAILLKQFRGAEAPDGAEPDKTEQIRETILMTRNQQRKLERLTKLLEKLDSEARKGIPIVVEGKHDCRALNALGISGDFFCLKSTGNILADQLDEVEGDEVILLVDFDGEGRRLARSVISYLGGRGVKVRSFFWRRMKALLRRDVKDVEGLPSYLERLKKNIGASV